MEFLISIGFHKPWSGYRSGKKSSHIKIGKSGRSIHLSSTEENPVKVEEKMKNVEKKEVDETVIIAEKNDAPEEFVAEEEDALEEGDGSKKEPEDLKCLLIPGSKEKMLEAIEMETEIEDEEVHDPKAEEEDCSEEDEDHLGQIY